MSGDIYLIDFENVQPSSIGLLKPGACRIHVFVGQSQNKVPLELSQALQPFGADVCYTQITGNGSNALDFHIAFYIGQLAHEHPGARFTIVSKDTGFDPLVKHIGQLGISCRRIVTLPGVPKAPKKPAVAKAAAKKATPSPQKAQAKPDNVVVTVAPAPNGKVPAPSKANGAKGRVDEVVTRLKGLKASKPATVKTLKSSVGKWFKPALINTEVDAIIQSLADRKKIKVDGTKVTYSLG